MAREVFSFVNLWWEKGPTSGELEGKSRSSGLGGFIEADVAGSES
jgi:hypothetical protein